MKNPVMMALLVGVVAIAAYSFMQSRKPVTPVYPIGGSGATDTDYLGELLTATIGWAVGPHNSSGGGGGDVISLV